jgi:hypothetical protein
MAYENMTQQELIDRIHELEATKNKISCKVSDKGAVSVYGLHVKFPVTLYAKQWERLLGQADTVKAFIKAHRAELEQNGSAANRERRPPST